LIHLLHRRYKKARDQLNKAVVLEESGTGDIITFVGSLTMMGSLYLRQKQYAQALEWCKSWLENAAAKCFFLISSSELFRCLIFLPQVGINDNQTGWTPPVSLAAIKILRRSAFQLRQPLHLPL